MRYRNKPVVIEAFQLILGADMAKWPDWFREAIAKGKARPHPTEITLVLIDTTEGTMTAGAGDWIIKGVEGELYPCKPSVFAATYVPADWSGR